MKNKNTSKKVIVRVKGGLGNQLFCYATARRLAIVNNAELVIDDVTGFKRDFKYKQKYLLNNFRIDARKATPAEIMVPFERVRRKIAKMIAIRKPYNNRFYIQQEGNDFDVRLLNLKVSNTVYLDGYWQSEGYFKDVEQDIRKDLQIIPPDNYINKKYAEIIQSCNSIAIHVRWFESFGTESIGQNAPLDYYNRAIRGIRERVEKPHFFIFSDNTIDAQKLLNLSSDEATYVSHNKGIENAYADLWLMTLCKHFITANSSFSWWGAWLGAKQESKIVITPKMIPTKMRQWGFRGLIPKSWLQI